MENPPAQNLRSKVSTLAKNFETEPAQEAGYKRQAETSPELTKSQKKKQKKRQALLEQNNSVRNKNKRSSSITAKKTVRNRSVSRSVSSTTMSQ